MTETTLADQVSAGFVSYRRDDNRAFRKVVDQLHFDITNTFEARTGRVLDLFLDRESIGWGENWREKIAVSVQGATVFIPIITMRYFTSQACRDELIAFHEAAKNLGVTELLLPIVLMGAENISKEDERPEVRLIESLNYKNIEPQFRAGYDSPAWLSVIDEIVADLIDGLQTAENALSAQVDTEVEVSLTGTGLVKSGSGDGEPRPSRPHGAVEPLEVTAISAEFDEITDLTEKAQEAIEKLGNVAEVELSGMNFETMPQKQVNVSMLRVAKAFEEPARLLEARGQELEAKMTETDARLRRLVDELKSMKNDNAQELLANLIGGFGESSELEGVEEQMEELISQLNFASVLSVAIRKSLQPAIRGIRGVQTAASTFIGWQNLAKTDAV